MVRIEDLEAGMLIRSKPGAKVGWDTRGVGLVSNVGGLSVSFSHLRFWPVAALDLESYERIGGPDDRFGEVEAEMLRWMSSSAEEAMNRIRRCRNPAGLRVALEFETGRSGARKTVVKVIEGALRRMEGKK